MTARPPDRIGWLPLSVLILGGIAAVGWIAVLICGVSSAMAWLF